MSGELTAEDEAAVDDELAAILSEEMPEVPYQEPDVKVEDTEEPLEKGKTVTYKNESNSYIWLVFFFRIKKREKSQGKRTSSSIGLKEFLKKFFQFFFCNWFFLSKQLSIYK